MRSCWRRLESSSTSASIFEDDFHSSRSSRPSIPCFALFTCSSEITMASASKSIERGRWQTGHSGYLKDQASNSRKERKTYSSSSIRNCFKILPNALAIEDMVTLWLNGILSNVVTDSANRRLHNVTSEIYIPLALQDEVRMACLVNGFNHILPNSYRRKTNHLPHACNQSEDIWVIWNVHYLNAVR